jgi:hypothetical protein
VPGIPEEIGELFSRPDPPGCWSTISERPVIGKLKASAIGGRRDESDCSDAGTVLGSGTKVSVSSSESVNRLRPPVMITKTLIIDYLCATPTTGPHSLPRLWNIAGKHDWSIRGNQHIILDPDTAEVQVEFG